MKSQKKTQNKNLIYVKTTYLVKNKNRWKKMYGVDFDERRWKKIREEEFVFLKKFKKYGLVN
jgi:hypothetical protein